MEPDKEVRDYVEKELAVMRQGCSECRRMVEQTLNAHQRSIDQLAENLRSDRAILTTKFDTLSEKIGEACEMLKGGAEGSIPTRLAVLERDNASMSRELEELKKTEETTRKEQGKTMRDAFIQATPTFVGWLGLGIMFLIYLIFSHFGTKPPTP